MDREDKFINHIKEKLKSAGYKLTKQRLYIINTIYKNDGHMCVDEIYKRVKDKKIGLTTVYRNLMIFEKIGIVRKIEITDVRYYELNMVGDYKLHIHAKCSKCNRIVDINEMEGIEEYLSFVENLKKKLKIAVESTSIVVSGLCKGCD